MRLGERLGVGGRRFLGGETGGLVTGGNSEGGRRGRRGGRCRIHSAVDSGTRNSRLELALDLNGYGGGDEVVSDPVDAECGGDVEGEPTDEEGEELEDGVCVGSVRVSVGIFGGLEELLGDGLGDDEEDGDGDEAEGVVPAEAGGGAGPLVEDPVGAVGGVWGGKVGGEGGGREGSGGRGGEREDGTVA